MGIQELIPSEISKLYEVYEWRHAAAVLKTDFPSEWNDVMALLKDFRLKRSQIEESGGNKSSLASDLDGFLSLRGWVERGFDTAIRIDNTEINSPTHKVDCYKNNVALEIEWNNKDPFFDRDLNNFRLLFDLRVISVGIIITRSSALQKIFTKLGKGSSYGNSTTHINKLLPRINGGGGGGCPILVFGITEKLYIDDSKGKK